MTARATKKKEQKEAGTEIREAIMRSFTASALDVKEEMEHLSRAIENFGFLHQDDKQAQKDIKECVEALKGQAQVVERLMLQVKARLAKYVK